MIAAALTALVTSLGTAGAAPYVIAIGVNDPGRDRVAPLQFADDDAAEAVALFGARAKATYLHTILDRDSRERHQALAPAARPLTLQAVRDSVADLRSRIDADVGRGESPQVIVWLAGHGVYDDDGHISVPLNRDERLTATSLTDILIEPLARAHRIHLVLDTCFAGGLLGSRAQTESVPPAEVERAFAAISPRRFDNVGVFLGSTASTRSFEWTEISSGVFSAVLRAGMRGAADADGGGTVRYSELSAFATAAAEGVRVPEARPRVRALSPRLEGDAPIAQKDWLGDTATLRGDFASLGTVHILDDTGRWLLASHFEPGFVPELWLPKDRALFLRARGQDHALVVEAGGAFAIGPAAPHATGTRSLMSDALRTGLFSATFGPTYWRGYRAALTVPAPPAVDDAGTERGAFLAFGLAGAAGGAAAVAGLCAVGAGGTWWAFTQEHRQVPALNLLRNATVLVGVGLGHVVVATALAGTATVLAVAE